MNTLKFKEPTMVPVLMSCYSTTVFESKTIDEILETIKTGGWIANSRSLQELTANARELAALIPKGDKDNKEVKEAKKPYDEFKRKMVPTIMTHALFETGKGRKSTDPHSFQDIQYLMFDFDHVENIEQRLADIHENPLKYEIFHAVWTSLSGTGLHALVAIRGLTDENIEYCYKTIGEIIEYEYELTFDTICRDVTRMCILSYDPNIFINEQSEIFDATEMTNSQKIMGLIPYEEIEPEAKGSDNKGLALYLDKMNIQMIEGKRHHKILRVASILNYAGFDREAVKIELKRFVEPNFEEKEINDIVDHIYNKWKDQHGEGRKKWEEERRKNLRNGQFGQNGQYTLQIDEEKFFSHIWEKQPEITEYESCLPKLVWNAVDRNKPEDIQWALLQSGICVFSAMMPHLTIEYDGSIRWTQYSCMWIGDSGSGKGKITDISRIHNAYALTIEREFRENVIRPAQQTVDEWNKCMEEYKAKKQKERETPCDCGEKPIVPEEKKLQLPISTSESRFAMRLAANEPFPTFRYTEEMGTMYDNNKKDYGISRSNLREGLEGGRFAVDYKESGYVGTDHAKWVDMLAGTPSAAQQHLNNQEDGTPARYEYLLLESKGFMRDYSKSFLGANGWIEYESKIATFALKTKDVYARVDFSREVEDIIYDQLEESFNKYAIYSSTAIASYIKRNVLMTMKKCAILTFLKAYEEGELLHVESNPNSPIHLECSKETAQMVASWLPYLFYCAARVIFPLKKNTTRSIAAEDLATQELYNSLPCEFTTNEMNAKAQKIGMNEKTVQRRRDAWLNVEPALIEKIGHGKYRKLNCQETETKYL